MRIVAGRWRGRQIETPLDDRVRPTTDKIREAWLSIVAHDIPEARVLDLFAGSGALGLEALSRGAASVEFVESSLESIKLITRNAQGLGAGDAAQIRRDDALRFIADLPASAYHVAFADPPYATDAAIKVAERWSAVPFADVLGVEHGSRTKMPLGGETRRYGITSITFYRRQG